jgi:hypothetical protein
MGKAFMAARPGIFKALGRTWHRDMLPQHFKAGAEDKYKYKRRTKGYKRRKKGKPPLVWTGDLRAKATGIATIRSSVSGVKVKMATPPWLARTKGPVRNTRTVKGRTFETIGPDIPGELTTISDDEQATINKAAQKRLKNVMKNAKTKEKIVV